MKQGDAIRSEQFQKDILYEPKTYEPYIQTHSSGHLTSFAGHEDEFSELR